jgi:hypothetical protein
MNKHITTVIAESGAYHDLQIAPGTTPREIRAQLGLSDQYLISKRGNEPFGDDESIYGAVADGEKLFLSTPVEVGSFMESTLLTGESVEEIIQRLQQRPQVPQDNAKPAELLPKFLPKSQSFPLAHHVPMLVQRDQRPYWEQRGWTSQGGEYLGYFRTRFGSWKGKAEASPSGRIDLFIQDPPDALKGHSHWVCFRSRLGGWFFIHTNEPIEDLSSGILTIEKILTEAHSQ